MKKACLMAGLVSLTLLGACSQQSSEKTPDKAKKDTTTMQEKKGESNEMKHDKGKSDQMVNKGSLAPNFELTGVDGKVYRLSDFKGKKVYLKFWASWCSICLSSLPETEELAKEQGDDYVVLTVVSPNHNGEQSTEGFKKWYNGLEYKGIPVLLDEKGKGIEDYGIRGYPTAAFIGSDGVLVKTQVGFMSKEDIKKTLDSIH
ncbi:TlpA family protein disulfide reductase [Streptococcus merionis]|uniref:Disulfide interchange protein n=1 Tax=Streptococcus merionis TaxID=400065 RepID=A0A239SQK2_9STRE|nr:redoxin family protein [Streptococcus merionis]SNU87646.1 disulfide interchange protein [Streptococcus merionis]